MAGIKYKPKRKTTAKQASQDVLGLASPVGIARAAGRVPSLAHKVGAHVIRKIRAGRRHGARLLAKRTRAAKKGVPLKSRRMALRGRR